jgi:hypothetical protein
VGPARATFYRYILRKTKLITPLPAATRIPDSAPCPCPPYRKHYSNKLKQVIGLYIEVVLMLITKTCEQTIDIGIQTVILASAFIVEHIRRLPSSFRLLLF